MGQRLSLNQLNISGALKTSTCASLTSEIYKAGHLEVAESENDCVSIHREDIELKEEE